MLNAAAHKRLGILSWSPLANLAAADLRLDQDANATPDTASRLDPAPYPYGPFGAVAGFAVPEHPPAWRK